MPQISTSGTNHRVGNTSVRKERGIMARRPWETPIEYTDDRFEEASPSHVSPRPTADDDLDERGPREIEDLLNREPRAEKSYECNDSSPLDYTKGPHDEVFGVDESQFDAPDADPVPYDKGPHYEELGLDDEG
jgi:hypothetical protein